MDRRRLLHEDEQNSESYRGYDDTSSQCTPIEPQKVVCGLLYKPCSLRTGEKACISKDRVKGHLQRVITEVQSQELSTHQFKFFMLGLTKPMKAMKLVSPPITMGKFP
ncbi:hypothetical protein V6N13_119153 [Hibiscus sabdariffa]